MAGEQEIDRVKLGYLFSLCGWRSPAAPAHCYPGTSPRILQLPFVGFLNHAHTFLNCLSRKLFKVTWFECAVFPARTLIDMVPIVLVTRLRF